MTTLSIIKNNFVFSNLRVINFSIFLIFLFPLSIITGPFLPDLILSSVALIGLILYLKKIIKINFYREILYLWVFYIFTIITSLFSENIVYSLDYSLFYFRFIIFTHFIIYLLINIPKLTNLLIKGILISFFVMIIYSTIELILYTQMGHIDGLMRRLHLLFSDEAVVGSFMVRMLPILCFFIVLNKDNIKSIYLKFFLTTIIILSFIFIIFSGERTALLLLIILSFLYLLILIKFYKKLFFIFFISLITIFFSIIFFSQNIIDRTLQDLDRNISLNPEINPYLNYSLVSLEMFKESPIIGKGPKMFRIFCPDARYNDYVSMCNIHPHSIYAQLLAEMGLVGFLFIFAAFVYTILIYLKNLISKNPNKLYLFASVGFIINFFPLVPSGNFFNNWINNLYYLSIIVIIYSMNKTKKLL